ncbi:MAG TPA: 4Fe-4S binding protein [Holophagaceae bacterium]|nr:4Fe-4S binding protein [Holophagaceae bacterium]
MDASIPASPRFHVARRITQVGLLLFWALGPWLDFTRIDIQDQSVTYLGRTYPLTFPYVLGLIIPFVVTVWGLALLSYLKGRVFCGWACPYGSVVELFDGLRTAVWKGTNRKVAAWMRRSALHRWSLRTGAALTLFLAPVALALCLAAYLYSPAKIVALLRMAPGAGGTPQLALWTWIALVVVIGWVAGFLVRFHFCRYVCIYGMAQAMVASTADDRTILRPRFLPAELDACGSCQACLKACFVDLDPREQHLQLGFGLGCFNCGECVEVCGTVQGHKDQAPLLSFRGGRR